MPNDDKYQGAIGPEDAMSALDPLFTEAYRAASSVILNAVIEFEKATGRVVENVSLDTLEMTQFGDAKPVLLRQVEIKFLPTPREVAW